ncbi:MAG: hypothetical protein WC523_03525 [Patescibacteria group bacterium]
MALNRAPKNQNSLNLLLNNYFSVITVVIVIFVLAVAYFFWLRPKFTQTLSAIKADIEMHEKLYAAQQKKLTNLKAIAELYKKIDKNDLQKFNGLLTDNYVMERLFGELEEIVSSNSFVLDSVKLSRPEESGDGGSAGGATAEAAVASQALSPKLGQINVDVSISKIDYAGFKNLVKIFENNLRLLDIVKLDFSPSGGTANFTFATYYYKKVTP